MSARLKIKIGMSVRIVIISCLVGCMIGVVLGYGALSVIVGGMAGFLISGSLLFVDHIVYAWSRRVRFVQSLVVRTLVYAVCTAVGLELAFGLGSLLGEGTFRLLLNRTVLATFLVSIIVSFAFNIALVINRMLGKNVLRNFIIGKYHVPVGEDRIFTFLDLTGSTKIAESIGNTRYHQFLNEFIFDITECILRVGGEIYKYVGDEVIVTWPAAQGLKKANYAVLFIDKW